MGYFDIVALMVIFGSFSVFFVKWLISRKLLASYREKRIENLDSAWADSITLCDTLYLVISKVILGSLDTPTCFKKIEI